MIKTIDEAVAILDGFEKKIPYEAIEFLRNQPTSEIILDKIVFALKNAYADLYYNEEINEWSYAPLWYAIVAEKQKPGHEDSLKLAQKVLYKAEMEEDAQKRIALAKKAIEISPLCADAYCLLAEESDNIQTAIEYYKKGVEAGELAIGKETFLEDVGYFWGLLETRPYMRARFGLAQCLYKNGNFEEAISHYRELLRLNPSDNQGVRYSLASALANLKRYNELNQLLNSNDYREDSSANWLYTRALLDFVKFGESEKSIKTLREAIMVNPHVAKYLTGISSIPEILPDHITIGDEDEAMVYAFDFAKAWEIVPGSIEWLERNHSMQVKKKSTKIGRNDPCPCGSGKKYKKCCGK